MSQEPSSWDTVDDLAGVPPSQPAAAGSSPYAGMPRYPGTSWPQQPADPGTGTAGHQDGRPLAGWLDGRRLAAVAAVTVLAAAVFGGLAGGYIATRDPGSGVDPSFSLGTVAPAISTRPVSSVPGIAARVLPSVVMIKVDGGEGTGSGFIIGGGYIVTDNHVVTLDSQAKHASLQVIYYDGRQASAKLVGRDPYSDIAVIKPSGDPALPALPLGNSDSVAVGDPVLAVGAPLGLADTVTSGIVSALNRPVQPGSGAAGTPQVFYDAIQTDAPINPGNSGGPLVNGLGQVIGVDSAIDTLGADPMTGTQGGSIGLGFAIPINHARYVAVQLIRTGRAAHSVIGALINVSYSGVGAQIATSRPGAVAAVSRGGPAARAGLLPGDVITSLGGQPVTSADALLDAIRSRQPGTQVWVQFDRHGVTRTVRLTLGSALS